MASVEIRLYNPEWNNLTKPELVTRKDVHGKYPMEFEVFWSGAAAAAAELGGAPTAAKDGTTTPYQLTIVSAAATDIDTGAGHVRALVVVGISVEDSAAYVRGETGRGQKGVVKYSCEEVRMNGTTDVLSVRWYLRVIHAYAIEWGSGDGDASNTITVESPANTALLTIAAGDNESGGGTIWGVENYEGRWNGLELNMTDLAFNNV